MDMQDASSMTEASGLMDYQTDRGELFDWKAAKERGSRDPAPRFSDQVRDLTRSAPLSSLLIAFVMGILVARRR